ncbi:MAG TPA: murein biosynthesis integral membrane protein MurJ [Acidimicrobiales bacterium]|nr:murein biosynthesis integral membrane protein MurJ [Acidimicrobiales bacterium]
MNDEVDPEQTEGAIGDLDEAPSIIRSSAVMALGTAASRLTGFVRLAAMLYALGVDRVTDTYTLANTTPNIVYELLLGGVLSATLVPIFVHHFEEDDEDGPSAIVTVMTTMLVALTVIGIVAAPWILRLYTSTVEGGTAADQREVGTALLRLFMPQMLFYGLTAMGTALLNARRRFAAPAWVPVLNNLLVSAVLFAIPTVVGHHPTLDDLRDDTGLLWLLGLGTTAGIVAMTVALWPFVRRAGIHLRWLFEPRHAAVREVARLSGWTVGYVVTNQIALLVVLLLANRTAGGVASYTVAFVFFQLPHALVAVSLMSALVPEMSSAARAGDMPAYKRHFSLGIRLISLVVMPAATGYIVLAHPIVTALVEYGAADDVGLVSDSLAMFAVGLLGFSIYLFTLRGFYALRDTRTPFLLNVVENAINIALAIALEPWLGVKGLALALALAYSTSALIAFVALRRRVGLLGGRRLVLAVGKVGVASVAMGLAVLLVAFRVGSDEGAGAIVRTGVGVVVGLLVFAVTVVALRTEEVSALRSRLKRA